MSKNKPQMNGTKDGKKYIDSIDVDDPEYVRDLRRPVEVKQDVRQMEERKRVNMILKSKQFRHELEEIVVEQIKTGPQQPSSAQALQQITDMFPAQSRNQHNGPGAAQRSGPVAPIAEFTGEDLSGYEKGEKLTRSKLAACCRLIDIFGWSQGDQSYVTVRTGADVFLAVPQDSLYRDVTAGELVKVDAGGQVLNSRSPGLPINRALYAINEAVHSSRTDVRCVIYLHNASAIAVSELNCGLLPLSQDAMSLGEISYAEYGGGGDSDQRSIIREALGPVNKVLILKQLGVLVGGETIEEAFHLARSVMNAIDTQLRTMPLGLENIHLPSEETRKRAFERANKTPSGDDGKRRWMRGELEFEALMRHLENSGYKTGYVFHAPLIRQAERLDRVNAEVEVPPASTSFIYTEEDASNAVKDRNKKVQKIDWLNSPNAYKKEESEEKGAPRAKKITRWVSENAPGTLIKIESPNQFAPIGTDPKELKSKFREIRKDHYDEDITAGPQSKILEGVTWEEAQKIKEGHVASDTIIVVGAASRGIIQRDHQTTANTYKTYYAPNPFESMTEEDVEEYKAEITKKTKRNDGLTTEEEDEEVIVPGPDGRLISSDERMQQVRQAQAEAGGRITPEVKHQLSVTTKSSYHEEQQPAAASVQAVESRQILSDKPLNKSEGAAAAPVLKSPTRSTSSGDGTHGGQTSGTETGTGREQETPTPGSGAEKKKKKRGFRMPSFSSKKKDKA